MKLFVLNSIGGRFSVLTPVGIYLMAAAGIDVDAAICKVPLMLDLSTKMMTFMNNDCLKYAAFKKIYYIGNRNSC